MANRIQEHRERLGWNQAELARRVGCGQQMMSRLEAGKRALTEQWLWRVAAALAVHPADLLVPPVPYPKARKLSPKDVERLSAKAVERQMLSFWRRLTPEQKDLALVLIDRWADAVTRQARAG